ncbi:PorT family protein [Crocinitomicaceae bacterium]|nr:PorT family protein [Crocinitomicaceae bacterium]
MRGVILIVLLLICFGSLNAIAQWSVENKKLASRFRPGIGWFYNGGRPYEEEKLRKYDRLMVDLVYNDWHGDRDYFESPWQSIGFNVSLMFDKLLTKSNTVSFGWGLAFSHANNHSPVRFNRDTQDEFTFIDELPLGEEPLRNKFSANYIEIPLELRFKTKGYKHFKFMLGGKIGYQLNAYDKIINKVNGITYSTKNFNFPDRNPLRYGATVRIGIRNWSLFGAYYFSELFTNGQSVSLTPYSVGLTISLF